ncbi:hypothetical protein IJJ54_01180 [Candidatus Saccharibacteria bacterium]|nr:hypothetical protein [Candidatus Saccharibacteria bacterium]
MKLSLKLSLLAIAGVFAGFLLSASSASAESGLSILERLNNRSNLLENIQDPLNGGCESESPESTISCNESPFSELLFNRITDGTKLYGHDGKGIIFTDTEQLVNGDPQLRTANRGDVINFSAEYEMERYYDDNEMMPITKIEIAIGYSEGIAHKQDFLAVKVGGQVIPASSYEAEDVSSEGAFGLSSFTLIIINWHDGSSFIYPEDSDIEIVYSATIEDDAPSEVFSRVAYAVHYNDGTSEKTDWSTEQDLMYPGAYQATAMLDGNIVIRQVDNAGEPVKGARFTIEGLAVKADGDGRYSYDENGDETMLTANESGIVIVTGVPFGSYTVTEIGAGGRSITKDISTGLTSIKTGRKTLSVPPVVSGARETDITEKILRLDDGKMIYPYEDFFELLGFGGGGSMILTYNESMGDYRIGETGISVKKVQGDYFLNDVGDAHDTQFVFDNSLGKYVATFRLSQSTYESYTDGEVVFDGERAIVDAELVDHLELSYDDSLGCYVGQYQEKPATLCEDEDGFILDITRSYDDISISTALSFSDNGSGQFLQRNSALTKYVIDNVTESEMTVTPYATIDYNNKMRRYYLDAYALFTPMKIGLTEREESILAVEFLFRDKTSNATPEDIPANPQTSDTVLVVAFGALLVLGPAAFVRKKAVLGR